TLRPNRLFCAQPGARGGRDANGDPKPEEYSRPVLKMTRSFTFALIGVCTLALSAAPIFAKEAPAAATTQKSATPPGTETLNVGETPEEAQQRGDSVAAIVNDTVITDYDLRQRMGLYIATSNAHPTPDM